MRRGLAGLILGLSLIVASVSWAGFVMTRTVLDPGRSERLADQLLENEVLHDALVSRLSDGLGATLPAEVPVPRQQLELAAETALEDERVEALIRDGIVRLHRNALEGNDEPIVIDASALGAASRDSLIATRPELEEVVPVAPPVEIALPTSGLSWLGRGRDTVTRFTTIFALTATAGALLALLVTQDRPRVLRRVSLWAFGAAFFWMIIGYGIPFLARSLAPSSSAIVAAIIDVFFGAMITPAIAMAVFGAVLLGSSMAWSVVATRRPATLLHPRTRPTESAPLATPVADGTAATGGQWSNIRQSGDHTRVDPRPRSTPSHGTGQTLVGTPSPVDPDQTTQLSDYLPSTDGTEAGQWETTAPRPRTSGTWVEGVGYLDDDPS